MREHIELTQDAETNQWRSRRHYANGRKGEGTEESFTKLQYLIVRTQREHPGVPIHVVDNNGGDYWIEEVAPEDAAD